ncbi:hypothetical protein MDA_GLEAN10004024 [Myotis davidii]|uniref:Uncharacterized protein n=1 Tax=Myotis davidii TaxID=225400 RepID=L5MIP5_MYODS|nr:hypothetical protein MDA_GLEAN10004024 [Myotis davidii]
MSVDIRLEGHTAGDAELGVAALLLPLPLIALSDRSQHQVLAAGASGGSGAGSGYERGLCHLQAEECEI